ncbi:CHRD domain-containing protein [Candidatus Kaiserbacteria bacterium]|nr:CHRD domain-containing protein [Candidatus Kaiserbacteria bacterium]
MNTNVQSLSIIGAAIALSLAFIGFAMAADTSISVALSGGQEVPPVTSTTTGTILVEFDDDGENMTHTLTVQGNGITAAHFHCGSAGENGPPVVTLFSTSSPGVNVNGVLSSGGIDDGDIASVDCNSVIGRNISDVEDLAEAIEDDDVYVNVHSIQFPAGAARAQLPGEDGDDDGDDGDDDGDDDDGEDGDEEEGSIIRQLMNHIKSVFRQLIGR